MPIDFVEWKFDCRGSSFTDVMTKNRPEISISRNCNSPSLSSAIPLYQKRPVDFTGFSYGSFLRVGIQISWEVEGLFFYIEIVCSRASVYGSINPLLNPCQ